MDDAELDECVMTEIALVKSLYEEVEVVQRCVVVRLPGSTDVLAVSMHVHQGYPSSGRLTCALRFESQSAEKSALKLQDEVNHLTEAFIGQPVMQIVLEHCWGVIGRHDSIEYFNETTDEDNSSGTSEGSRDSIAFTLPYDCWTEISLFLGPVHASRCVATLNRWLHYLVTDDDLWRCFFLQNTPICHVEVRSKGNRGIRWTFTKGRLPRPLAAPWSLPWSYRLYAMQQRIAACDKWERNALEVDEKRLFVQCWKELYATTKNPLAQQWAHVMCNFHAGMGNTALRLIEAFPFDRVPKRLAAILRMPFGPAEVSSVVKKVRYRSLDTDEENEKDIIENASVFIKERDVHTGSQHELRETNVEPAFEFYNEPQPSKLPKSKTEEHDTLVLRRIPRHEFREACRQQRARQKAKG